MKKKPLLQVGWRERVSLPELGINAIKAKVDTGAATSSLYARNITYVDKDDQTFVRFLVHPRQDNTKEKLWVEAPLLEKRKVKSSNGESETRPVIRTKLELADRAWTIELTLSSRRNMTFRMLLGREALRKRAVVNVDKSYLVRKGTTL